MIVSIEGQVVLFTRVKGRLFCVDTLDVVYIRLY